MVEFMAKLREEITIGVVGGSDLPKQKEQLGESGELSSEAYRMCGGGTYPFLPACSLHSGRYSQFLATAVCVECAVYMASRGKERGQSSKCRPQLCYAPPPRAPKPDAAWLGMSTWCK